MKNLCLYNISLCVVKCFLRAKEEEREWEEENERGRERVREGERQWVRDPHKLGFLKSRKDRWKDLKTDFFWEM